MMSKYKVLVLNGLNFNLLGICEFYIYGVEMFVDFEQCCCMVVEGFGLEIEFCQLNVEYQLIDWLYVVCYDMYGIVINLVVYMYMLVVLVDVFFVIVKLVIEVYILNVYCCEVFCYYLYILVIVEVVICGCGIEGYVFVLQCLVMLFVQGVV